MASAADRSTSPPKLPLWRRRWLRRVLIAVGALTLLGLTAVGIAALWAFTILPRSLPSVTALETLQPIQGTKIYDDNDEPMTELHVERRILVPLAQIPQSLRDAIIATEDRRFYSHWSVDPIGIARAVVQNYRRGRIVEGGSTITQQLAKVLFLTADKSLERKLKEAVLALELERRYSKDRILEMYLNQVYFGHGAYGVEADRARGRAPRRAAARAIELLAVRPRQRGQTATRARPAPYGGVRRAEGGGGEADRADGPGPHRARAAPDHRPVLPRLRPADARGEVRRRPRLQGRSEHLHDPEPLDAARGGAGDARRLESAGGALHQGAPRREPRGCHHHDRAADRLREGDGRWLQIGRASC